MYYHKFKFLIMKKKISFIVFLMFACSILYSLPKTDFYETLINKECNPSVILPACRLAENQNLPVEVYMKDKALIEAASVENGKVVYTVITNFLHPFSGGYCAFYEDIAGDYDLTKARLTYASGKCTDNTGEVLNFSTRKTIGMVYLIPCMTSSRRNVFAFDYNTGDLVDTAFIPYSNPILQTPRKVLQLSRTQVLVADQLSDVVQLFDTSGAYIRVYCPAGGLNNAILDNVRDMTFRPNGNILVTNAGTVGNSYNTVQQFDHSGNFINSFITDSVNSPYNLLQRTNDILLSNSSGTHNIGRYNPNTGSFIGDFIASSLNFPQQLTSIGNGKIAVCEFSGVLSGIRIYDSLGVLTDTLKGVTGVRGSWKMPNGNFLVTNSTGVYEVNGTTGSLVRTIVSGYNFNCISVFDPNMITAIGSEQQNNSTEYKLFNNYPNPFNPNTIIRFQIKDSRFTTLKIYNLLGKEVAVLVNETKTPGTYEVSWDAVNYPAGVYFYKLTAGNFSETKKMMLVK